MMPPICWEHISRQTKCPGRRMTISYRLTRLARLREPEGHLHLQRGQQHRVELVDARGDDPDDGGLFIGEVSEVGGRERVGDDGQAVAAPLEPRL